MTETTRSTIIALWVAGIVTIGSCVWKSGPVIWYIVGLLYLVTAMTLMVTGGPKPPERRGPN